jgi:hypothetical protein
MKLKGRQNGRADLLKMTANAKRVLFLKAIRVTSRKTKRGRIVFSVDARDSSRVRVVLNIAECWKRTTSFASIILLDMF